MKSPKMYKKTTKTLLFLICRTSIIVMKNAINVLYWKLLQIAICHSVSKALSSSGSEAFKIHFFPFISLAVFLILKLIWFCTTLPKYSGIWEQKCWSLLGAKVCLLLKFSLQARTFQSSVSCFAFYSFHTNCIW